MGGIEGLGGIPRRNRRNERNERTGRNENETCCEITLLVSSLI